MSDSSRKNTQSNAYNWKGVLDIIKGEVKTSTTEWTTEKQSLQKKIYELENEIKTLKKANKELMTKFNLSNSQISANAQSCRGVTAITISSPLNLDRKIIAEKLFHKRGESDKLLKNEDDKLHKYKGKIVKSKQNSDDIPKSDRLKNIIKRKTNSFGGFEKLIENPSRFNQNSNIGSGNTVNSANGSNGGTTNSNIINSNSNIKVTIFNNNEENHPQEGHHSSRPNYNSNFLSITGVGAQQTKSTNKSDFTKLFVNNSKLSEKEEESSVNTQNTQETIAKRPHNFLNSSNSENLSNSKEIGNITTISNNNNISNFIVNTSQNHSPSLFGINASSTVEEDENRHSIVFQPGKSTNNVSRQSETNEFRRSIHEKTDKVHHKKESNLFLNSNVNSKNLSNPFLVIKSHYDSVRDCYLTPDRETLVSIGEDMLINFWDFKKALKHNKENIEPYLTMRTHTTPVFSLTGPKTSFAVAYVYTSGMDGVIRSTKIPKVDYDKNIGNEDIISELCQQPWRAHQDMIWDLNYHPTESLMSSVSSDGSVKIFKGYEEYHSEKSYYSYDNRSKNLIRQFTFKNHYYNFIEIPTCSFWCSKKVSSLYVSHIAPFIKQYDLETGKSVMDYSYNVEKNIPFECQQANKLVHYDSVNLLISGHEDRQLRFFDPNQSKLIKSMVAHTDSVSSLSTGLKEYEFISGSHDGSIRFWDIRIHKLLFDIPAHRKKYDEGCHSIRAYPSEKIIISCGADGLIKFFQFT